ncbi:MAG: hypothetical protein EKK47_01165 [Burkholderiales bacterium]|nr:MAG: hypothetical protein EKK47_01165 [Burkholderiales bacterium]
MSVISMLLRLFEQELRTTFYRGNLTLPPEAQENAKRNLEESKRDEQLSGDEIVQEESQRYQRAIDAVVVKVLKKNDYEGNWVTYVESRTRGTDTATQSKMTVSFSDGRWEVKACDCSIPYEASNRMKRIKAMGDGLMNAPSPVEVRIVP